MYFKLNKKTQLLTIDDSYATLVDVLGNGDLSFSFRYSISQRQAVLQGVQRVHVSVFSRTVTKKSLLGTTQRGKVDTQGIVDNVRTAMIDAKSAVEQQSKYVVAERDSDITAHVNNEIIPQLRAGTSTKQIPSLNKTRLTLVPARSVKVNNDPRPVLHRIANSAVVPDLQLALTSSVNDDSQALMYDMILRQGLDPTYITQLTPRVQSACVTHGGLSNTQLTSELTTDSATHLLNAKVFPPTSNAPTKTTDNISDQELVSVLQVVSSDVLDIDALVVLQASKLTLDNTNVTQLFVTFDAIDSATNMPLDSITKTLDLSKHVQVFHTPSLAPIVTLVKGDQANLEIRQVDKAATEVQVYKKTIWVSTPDVDDYTLVGTYPLTSREQPLLIRVDSPRSSPVIYRVIPRGKDSMQGIEFTNVVVAPRRYVARHAVALTAAQVDNGVQLEARMIPTNVVAVQFLRWNLTTFDATYTTVNADVAFIDDTARRLGFVTSIDTTVSPSNTYKYVARLIYDNGDSRDFGDATIEFIQSSPGEVDVRINDLQVSHDDVPNVTFSVTVTTTDTDLDALKAMLKNQDMQQFFQGDIQAQRDQLKNLIAYDVQRVDLNTGQRDDFGVLTDSSFNDDVLRKNASISALKYGHHYRYEVYPMLRAPETMFDDHLKTMTDEVSKQPYSFLPAKFLHPLTLTKGVIVSTMGARQRFGKQQMSYGIIGNVVSTEVTFDDSSATLVEPFATRFNNRLNVVSWKVLGDLSSIDHFLVFKQVHGMRTLIGKTHSSFMFSSCQYIHVFGPRDVGALNYAIVPIMNDYTTGAEITTNTLIIEEA